MCMWPTLAASCCEAEALETRCHDYVVQECLCLDQICARRVAWALSPDQASFASLNHYLCRTLNLYSYENATKRVQSPSAVHQLADPTTDMPGSIISTKGLVASRWLDESKDNRTFPPTCQGEQVRN